MYWQNNNRCRMQLKWALSARHARIRRVHSDVSICQQCRPLCGCANICTAISSSGFVRERAHSSTHDVNDKNKPPSVRYVCVCIYKFRYTYLRCRSTPVNMLSVHQLCACIIIHDIIINCCARGHAQSTPLRGSFNTRRRLAGRARARAPAFL